MFPISLSFQSTSCFRVVFAVDGRGEHLFLPTCVLDQHDGLGLDREKLGVLPLFTLLC